MTVGIPPDLGDGFELLSGGWAAGLSGGQNGTYQTIIAHVGGGQEDATEIFPTSLLIVVNTVLNAGDSVKLPSAQRGLVKMVVNPTANSANIFGRNTTDTINGVVGTTAFALAGNSSAVFFSPKHGVWGATGVGSVGPPGTDYFSTFENLTTGAAPVSIDPTVFLSKITSGGTAGIEIVSFDDYTPDQSGKPHLIVFETQTDPADVIQIYGNSGNSNPVLISPFGPLANKLASGQFPAVFANTMMELTAVSQGVVLTWTDNAWGLTGQVGEPTITYPNAFKQQWDGANDGPSVLTQLTDGTYALVPDAVSPFLTATVTASSDINNPTIISCVPRGVGIVSTGLGGPGYVRLFGPDSDNLGTTNLQRSIFFKTRVNPADTIVFTNVTGNIANSDGSNLTSVTMTFADDQLAIHWDNAWVVDPQTSEGICVPAVLYSPPPIARVQANNADATITVPAGYMILGLGIENTNANAVTGGVKIGTTSGATDVVTAQAVGANAIIGVADATLLKKLFSMNASQNLFIQAVSSWNGAVVNFQFTYSRLA